MKKTVINKIYDLSVNLPNRSALIANNNSITYERLWILVSGFSNYLKINKIHEGSNIIVRCSQTISYIVTYLASQLSGTVFIPTDKNISNNELLSLAQKTECSCIITTDVNLICSALLINSADVEKIGQENYCNTVNFNFPYDDFPSDILFTTGTTGASKGVILSHKAVSAVAENLTNCLSMNGNTTLLVNGPLNHAYSLRRVYACLSAGGCTVILDGLVSLKDFFYSLENYSVNALALVPSALRTILKLTGEKISEYKNQILFIESATSPLLESDKESIMKYLPNTDLYNIYGSSESGTVTGYNYKKHPGLVNCVGKPLINSHIIIVDSQRNEIQSSPRNTGFIACKGDINMSGYYKDDDLTNEVMSSGYVYTNDIGYIEDGFVFITGRLGDVINIGGLKVSPTEVESAVLELDSIVDCICIAKKDSVAGSILQLLYSTRDNEDIDIAYIKNHLRVKLESYKIPRLFERAKEIKHTFNGKPDRKFYVQ